MRCEVKTNEAAYNMLHPTWVATQVRLELYSVDASWNSELAVSRLRITFYFECARLQTSCRRFAYLDPMRQRVQ